MSNNSDVYAVPTHKEALLGVLAERTAELGYSHASLEDVCGLTHGHVGKIFGPSHCKGLGLDTLYLLLPGLGLKLTLTVDRDALERYSQRSRRRNGNQVRRNNLAAKCGKRTLERALHHLATFDWNQVLHLLAKARAAVAAEQTTKAARRGAAEANKHPPASSSRRRRRGANGTGQQNGNGTASAYDAPIGDELEEIADAASMRVSRKDGERRGRKLGKVSTWRAPSSA